MNNKEALESIKNTKTNHIKNEKLGQPRVMYLVKELRKKEIQTIKKDLDKLEKLKKENQELLVNKNVAQGIAIKLKEENDKLKQALEILKDKFDIKISHTIEDIPIIIISLEETGEWYCIDISEEQYELLQEVLGND